MYGAFVGEAVGMGVGDCVGENDGNGVGEYVGEALGAGVGCFVGFGVGITTFSAMFQDATNLESVALFDTSSGTVFTGMFRDCASITTIPQFDTSGGTLFDRMFAGTSNLITIPLIDTGLAQDMQYMFYYSGISSVPLLDTSNVTNFYVTFAGTSNLTTLPLLDTSSGTNFEWIFYDAGVETMPLWDGSAGTSFSGAFDSSSTLALTRGGFTGVTRAVDYSKTALNLYAIKSILNGVGTASGAQTLTFNGTGDADDLNLADYTAIQAKGWTLLPAFTSNCTQWDAANLSSFYYLQNANLPGSGAASSAKYYYDCDSFSFKYADAGGDLVAISTESARRGDTAAMTAVTTAGEDEAYYDEQANQFKVGQANGTLSNLSAPSRSLDAAGIAAVTGATEGEFYFNTTTAKFHIANVGGTLDVMFTAP